MPFDWEQHVTEIENLKENIVAPNSRVSYFNSYSRFILWLINNKPSIIADEIFTNRNNLTIKDVKTFLKNHKEILPIKFELLNAETFLAFVMNIRKDDGNLVGYSALNCHRAALFNLFRDYNVEFPDALKKELSERFKALKRTRARLNVESNMQIRTGKAALQFDLYRFLSSKMLATGSKDCSFAHCFLIFSWNLMARSSNIVNIRHGHLGWSDDCLQVFFGHMKNDQTGSRPKDARHVYCNPLSPEICPILSLGLFWIGFPFNESFLLFPGSNQYERYRKAFLRVLDIEDVKVELDRKGLTIDD